LFRRIRRKKNDESELQALAFGFGKPKGDKKKVSNGLLPDNKRKKGKVSLNSNSTEKPQDEDWRKRDEEFIKAQNETSLREAILQSKLEYEAKKKEAKLIAINQENSDTVEASVKTSKGKRKKEKPLTISLSQFNNMKVNELETMNISKNESPVEKSKELLNNVKEEKFFKDVEEATKKTLEMEVRHEQYKEYRNKMKNISTETHLKNLTSEIEKKRLRNTGSKA